LTDLFPSRPEYYAEGYSQSFQNNNDIIIINEPDHQTTGGYDESSISLDEGGDSSYKKNVRANNHLSTAKKRQNH
jgi:hypothetical protein